MASSYKVTISILAILAAIVITAVLSEWDFFLRTSATVTVNGQRVDATVFRSPGGKVLLLLPPKRVWEYLPKDTDVVNCDPYNLNQFGPVATLVSGDICMRTYKAESAVPLDVSASDHSLAFNDVYAPPGQRIEIRW